MVKGLSELEFKKRVADLGKGDYQLLSPFTRTKDKVKLKHLSCGREYWVEAGSFLRGSRCLQCSRSHVRTPEEYKEEILKKYHGEYIVLGNYINNRVPIKYKHIPCGYEFEMKPTEFGRYNCRMCSRRKSPEVFKNEFYALVGDDYTLDTPYVNSRTKIRITHKPCGHSYDVVANLFLQGHRCPFCSSSNGELQIGEYLDKHNIPYKTQVRFESCKDILAMPFDFLANDSVLIEHQGRQHFEPVELFGGEDSFEYVQRHDKLKRDWVDKQQKYSLLYTYDDSSHGTIQQQLDKVLPWWLAK